MMTTAAHSEVFACHFKMFGVGVRCVLASFPGSACEANFYFEEEMASTFGEEKSVDTHFCQWLVSISSHSSFGSNISTMCARRTRFTFRVELQNNRMALVTE